MVSAALFAASLLLIAPQTEFAAQPSPANPSAADISWLKNLQQWRAEREDALKSPTGWLSLVALAWIHPGDNTIGSAADNSIRIAKLPPHLGILHLDASGVTIHPLPGNFLASFIRPNFPHEMQLNGSPIPNLGGKLIQAEDRPALVDNTLSMFVIQRADRTYLRVKDTQAPTLLNMHPLNWYAPDAHYLIRARWVPITPPTRLRITNILGLTIPMDSPGYAEFTLNGKTVRLQAVQEDPDAPVLTFLFRDTTSETTTYPAGRFLDEDFPDHGVAKSGTIILDFNQAYNPPCSFTPFATCPLPPPENRLKVAIPAGEKRYKDE